jgi:hypothetical protein
VGSAAGSHQALEEGMDRRRLALNVYDAAVVGALGGKIGITPRVYLKKLVGEVLDRIDQFPAFDSRQHYALTIADAELTEVERNARAAVHVDDIELDV